MGVSWPSSCVIYQVHWIMWNVYAISNFPFPNTIYVCTNIAMRWVFKRQFTVNHWHIEWQIKRFKCLIIECMHTTLMTLKYYKPNANFVAEKWKKKKEKKKKTNWNTFNDGTFDNKWQTLHHDNVSTVILCFIFIFYSRRMCLAPWEILNRKCA